MKALIAALIFAFAITVSAKNLTPVLQNQDKTKTTTTVDTKTTVSKDVKSHNHSKKSGKCTKDCKDKGSCCDPKSPQKDVK